MGLDYTKGCVNFRDIGESVNLVADYEVLPLRRIFRGGKLDFVETAEEIQNPGTIINVRIAEDPENRRFGADYWRLSASNDHEKYDTKDRVVRRWLNDVFGCLALHVKRLPVLIHCASGMDRTGVVIATLLTILEIERKIVIEEYLLSDGGVDRRNIEKALDGIGNIDAYFPRVDLARIRERFGASSEAQGGG
jgi:protein-tyrosine phosphatase